MIVSTLELSDVLEMRPHNMPDQNGMGIIKNKLARASDNEQETKNSKMKQAHLSQRTAMPRLISRKESNLDEIIGAVSKAKTTPVHRIEIRYGKKEKAGKDTKDVYDPTDSAQWQRGAKDKVYIADRLDIYFLEHEKQVTFDFSYIGSGIMKNAYTVIKDEFRTEADKWNAPPTPEQAGRLLMRILGDAVMKAGDHIDPNTKERMLFWMKTSEGAVWRVFYEMMAPVKTANYNFTLLS